MGVSTQRYSKTMNTLSYESKPKYEFLTIEEPFTKPKYSLLSVKYWMCMGIQKVFKGKLDNPNASLLPPMDIPQSLYARNAW